MVKFLRRVCKKFSKLGKGRKRKQVWRRPTGRDNKMREKRKGYPAVVSVGYKKKKKLKNLIENKVPVIIKNVKELNGLGKDNIIILGKIGMKKKLEILNKAKEMKIVVYKTNVAKFLKQNAKVKKIATQKDESKEKPKMENKK